jgi:hypothetical protein
VKTSSTQFRDTWRRCYEGGWRLLQSTYDRCLSIESEEQKSLEDGYAVVVVTRWRRRWCGTVVSQRLWIGRDDMWPKMLLSYICCLRNKALNRFTKFWCYGASVKEKNGSEPYISIYDLIWLDHFSIWVHTILFCYIEKSRIRGLKLSLFLAINKLGLGENKFVNYFMRCWR